ncbi:retinaldehyde-binding protein 1-like [Argiope bruennichi]|uniref:retinaldehyde-binding protein 1-like n=1 Tax=Argiope bruennichi TaxID=94029 RepID=UPI0024952580|nr:retinaldehyde-binding protein 1-like [Argiope bruennichi]
MMPTKENSLEENVLPFETDYLPDFVLKKAVVELNETSENKVQMLESLKELASDLGKIADFIFEDDFLRVFLRYSKYNISKAFAQLRNFVHFRRKYDSLFESIPEEYFVTKKSAEFFSVLPYRDSHGCTLVLLELGKWDPAELHIDDFKRLTLAVYLQVLRDPMTQINGFQVIHDFSGTSIEHLRYCTPQNLYFLYHGALNCFPTRYKGIHMVNESVVLKALWAIIKNFLPEKLKKRILFHSNPKDLLNFFPPSILPTQYGGDLIHYHNKNMIKKMNAEFGKSPFGGDPNFY